MKAFAKEIPGPLVLLPTHRSYIDFMILSYIFFSYNLPIPHIASREGFFNMSIVTAILKKCGAFSVRRYSGNDALYKAILREYVQQLVLDGIPIEFFAEGKRSRAGKLVQPKVGLLGTVAETFFDKRVSDMCLVPINITYEKVIESNAYAEELLGKTRPMQSLSALVRASRILRSNFGRISVTFGNPISLKKFVEVCASTRDLRPFEREQDKSMAIRHLATRVAFELNRAAVVMPTSMLAAIILMFRGGIDRAGLKLKMEWLHNEILSRGERVEWEVELRSNGESTEDILNHCLELLGKLVLEHRNRVYEPALGRDEELKNLLLLGFYRNQVTHTFFAECLCACAVYSMRDPLTESAFTLSPPPVGLASSRNKNAGIDRKLLLKEIDFLYSLFEKEFVHKSTPDEKIDFDQVLDFMLKRGILIEGDGKISAKVGGGGLVHPFSFLCSIFWSFIDAYYVAAVTMLSLHPDTVIHERVLSQRTEWLGEKFYNENKMVYFESCSMETLKNATKKFVELGILRRSRLDGESEYSICLAPEFQKNPSLLNSFVAHLYAFRRLPSGNTLHSTSMISGLDKIVARL